MTAMTRIDDAVSAEKRKQQFRLKHVLLFFLFVGIACGCIRYASVNELTILILPGIAFSALGVGTLTRRYLVSSIIVATLVLASYVTTSVPWDGGFPFVEMRITVFDEQNTPLEDVEIHVFDRKSGNTAHDYPIAEYGNTPLVTNRDGQITCHQVREGAQFGGRAWSLFWCIPMGTKRPRFDVRFQHPRYHTLIVPIKELFGPDYMYYDYSQFPTTTFVVNGEPRKMWVFERYITMPRR